MAAVVREDSPPPTALETSPGAAETDANNATTQPTEEPAPAVIKSQEDSEASCTPQAEKDPPQAANKKRGVAPVKSEYLLLNHVPRLAEEYLSAESKRKMQSDSTEAESGDQVASGKRKQEEMDPPPAAESSHPPSKRKKAKLKGRNQLRPVTFKKDDAVKICPAVLGERVCPYGERCKFYHDIETFMKEKPEDIGPECHNFKSYGRCQYGLACRFAKQHLTSDYKNVTNQELFDKMASNPQVLNVIKKDVQIQLRKKKYNFSKADSIVNFYVKKNIPSLVTQGNESRLGPALDEEEIRMRSSEKKRVDFSNKLYLAPLTTVGNLPFRRLCKTYGADITCGEMATAINLLQGQQSEWALLKRHHTEDIFGVQVCGAYPDTLTRCAQLINEQINVDFVDVNAGCPIDMFFNKGEGCALMGKATKFSSIIQCMTSVLDVPLTVKMRTGIFDNKNIAHNLMPKLRDAGVSLFTLHGRSREQRYTRSADWNYIKTCTETVAPVPLFGNGDILSYEDANLHREASGVSGLMIARGALIKPWIFTEIKEQRNWDISSKERFEMLQNFCDYGFENWGSDTVGIEKTRRYLLEWLSFLCRYIPVGLLEHLPQKINDRPPRYRGRNELETLMASPNCADWIKISEMLLGPIPSQFAFLPKHKANAYQ